MEKKFIKKILKIGKSKDGYGAFRGEDKTMTPYIGKYAEITATFPVTKKKKEVKPWKSNLVNMMKVVME